MSAHSELCQLFPGCRECAWNSQPRELLWDSSKATVGWSSPGQGSRVASYPQGLREGQQLLGSCLDEQFAVPRHEFPGVLALWVGESGCQGTAKGGLKQVR